ncbi:MAG TPA: thioredoxin domain-containing protein [Gaiellaceae bacterium]
MIVPYFTAATFRVGTDGGRPPRADPSLMQSWLRGQRAFAIAGIASALLAVGLVGASLATRSGEPAPAPLPLNSLDSTETLRLLRGIPQRGTVLGRADAPVTLVEYGDLQCPYCAHWSHQALPDLVRDYVRPGKLRIEFRGLAFLGPESDLGLRAALAAGEQRKLWHVVDLLYRNQGHENSGWLTETTLREVGASVPRLDVERMLARRAAMTKKLEAARTAATAAGVEGTPSFEVGRTGGRLRGVRISSLDANALRPAIESALTR